MTRRPESSDMNAIIRAGRTTAKWELDLSHEAIRSGRIFDAPQVPRAMLAEDATEGDGSAQDEQDSEDEGPRPHVGFDGGYGTRRPVRPAPGMNQLIAADREFARERRRAIVHDEQVFGDRHIR